MTSKVNHYDIIINKVTTPMAYMIVSMGLNREDKEKLLDSLGSLENRLKTMCDECGGKDA